ncbi:hypothetical protein VW29_00695 [Devosia limi DSM 17137]|uniref:Methyltransferase small domain-containing protein n=1 Tax=Devosia limi DSM 17137 TaxID=1121477 RepID=A0A0F5LWV2_9HYPH|nr:hypothetical protein VW29_00695 [Devosia limi DSM 17137]SHF93915.1 Methyltransferase small domain-containing protein [Devosia limi DSM 17137]
MFITSQSSFDRFELDRLDRYYTPSVLADQLVSLCRCEEVESIADFAAGAGSLLLAAKQRWPNALLFANDIDSAANSLHSSEIHKKANFNFLSEEFVAPRSVGRFKLVLLNPPFSEVSRSTSGDVGPSCSRALAFVLKALTFLADDGELIALLPSNILTSLKDREALTYLRSEYRVEVVLPPTRGMFGSADVSICALRLSIVSHLPPPTSYQRSVEKASKRWSIGRGEVSVSRAARKRTAGAGWVHTTSIADNDIVHRYEAADPIMKRKACPHGSILIPRVGGFQKQKSVLLSSDVSEVISDCIIWIWHEDREAVKELFSYLNSHHADLGSLYSGTGAQFVTYERIGIFIDDWCNQSMFFSDIEHRSD